MPLVADLYIQGATQMEIAGMLESHKQRSAVT